MLNLGDLGAHYANPVVLLYIGGFLIGIAIWKAAPCGSATTANRPTVGMSSGARCTTPPAAFSYSTIASTSATPM